MIGRKRSCEDGVVEARRSDVQDHLSNTPAQAELSMKQLDKDS